MTEKFDTDFQDDIVCPHCGAKEQDDLHEYFTENSNYADIDCHVCDKEFRCYREFSVEYSTEIIPCKNGLPHHWTNMAAFNSEKHKFYICRWCSKTEYRDVINTTEE